MTKSIVVDFHNLSPGSKFQDKKGVEHEKTGVGKYKYLDAKAGGKYKEHTVSPSRKWNVQIVT